MPKKSHLPLAPKFGAHDPERIDYKFLQYLIPGESLSDDVPAECRRLFLIAIQSHTREILTFCAATKIASFSRAWGYDLDELYCDLVADLHTCKKGREGTVGAFKWNPAQGGMVYYIRGSVEFLLKRINTKRVSVRATLYLDAMEEGEKEALLAK